MEQTAKRDFASLTPQEALHVAIFIEERNAEIYRQFAELFAEFRDTESLGIAEIFWEMANEERHHGTMLQEQYFDRYGTRYCLITEEDIKELIEVPRLDNGELFALARSNSVPNAARTKALEIALVAERSAQRFYSNMAVTTQDADLRALCAELGDFETSHPELLEKKLANAHLASGTERA